MRNRAKPSPPETPTAAAASAEPEPKKRTKYDELVDVLADGLFDVITDGDPLPSPHDRPRASARRSSSRR